MSSRIYVGKLPENINEDRLRDLFSEFGEILSVEVKTGFGFIFFQRVEDAERAIQKMHGTDLDGHSLLVENSVSSRSSKPVKRFDLRVTVDELDPRVSWQDLKDWAREAGDVTFTNVFNRDGKSMGVIEYKDERGFEQALKILPTIPISGALVKVDKDENPHNGEYVHTKPRDRTQQGSRGGQGHGGNSRDYDDRYGSSRDRDRDDRRGRDRERDRDYGGSDPRDRGSYPPMAYAPPPFYPPGPVMRYDGYDPRRYSDDYRRGGPPPMMGAPPMGHYRDRSRSRSRERHDRYPPTYPGGYPGGPHPPFRPYDGPSGPPPRTRYEESRRSPPRQRDGPTRRL